MAIRLHHVLLLGALNVLCVALVGWLPIRDERLGLKASFRCLVQDKASSRSYATVHDACLFSSTDSSHADAHAHVRLL